MFKNIKGLKYTYLPGNLTGRSIQGNGSFNTMFLSDFFLRRRLQRISAASFMLMLSRNHWLQSH